MNPKHFSLGTGWDGKEVCRRFLNNGCKAANCAFSHMPVEWPSREQQKKFLADQKKFKSWGAREMESALRRPRLPAGAASVPTCDPMGVWELESKLL